MYPQAEQEVKFVRKFLLGGGELEGGSGQFISFSLCIEEDDYKGCELFEGKMPPRRKSWLLLWTVVITFPVIITTNTLPIVEERSKGNGMIKKESKQMNQEYGKTFSLLAYCGLLFCYALPHIQQQKGLVTGLNNPYRLSQLAPQQHVHCRNSV